MKTVHIIILFGLVYCACAGSDFSGDEREMKGVWTSRLTEPNVDAGGWQALGHRDFTEDEKEKEKGTIVSFSKPNPDLIICTIDQKELCDTEETCNYYCISNHYTFFGCDDGECCCEYRH